MTALSVSPLEGLFPKRCMFCRALTKDGYVCENCRSRFADVRLLPDAREQKHTAERRLDELEFALASFRYAGAAAQLVKRYKFLGSRSLARAMAYYMASDLSDIIQSVKFDAIIPIPSYRDESDHAALLGSVLGSALEIKCDGSLLIKNRRTARQHELSKKQRESNLCGAFTAKKPDKIECKRLLLVDDVCTSGATLRECARTLREAGAAYVAASVFSATGN